MWLADFSWPWTPKKRQPWFYVDDEHGAFYAVAVTPPPEPDLNPDDNGDSDNER